MNKKGQLGNLQGIVFTLVVVATLIVAGFLLLGQFGGELDDFTQSVTNETEGFVNNSGYTVDFATAPGFNSLSITSAFEVNSTNAGEILVTIPSANLTVNPTTGVITNATATTYGDDPTVSNVSFTYTFSRGKAAFEGVDETTDAFDTIPNLLPLVILVGLIVIILALIFLVPGARRVSA